MRRRLRRRKKIDPFADEDSDDQDARMTAKAKAAPIAKSIVVWEVKPWGEDTDLDTLAAKIFAIANDGLVWLTEYKK